MFGEWTTASLRGISVANSSSSTAGGCVSFRHSSATLQNVDISNCYAPIGGGMHITDRSDIKLISTYVFSNIAFNGSGVFLTSSSLTGIDAFIQENTAEIVGGGIFVNGDSSVLNGLTVQNCTAPNGAGVMASQAQTAVFTDVTIQENTASNSGGGLFSIGSKITMTGVFLRSNLADTGGGLLVSNSAITGSLSISNNIARRGGGISISESAELTGLSVNKNGAEEAGGGLSVEFGVVTMTNVIFTSCFSDQGLGGAVFMQNATVNHSGVKITGCSASSGGGLYAASASFLSNRQSPVSRLADNIADGLGGAIYTTGTATTIHNIFISNGTATNGGGVAAQSCLACEIYDCYIGMSTAFQLGGGFYVGLSSNYLFHDSLVENNKAIGSGGGVAVQDSKLQHSNITIRGNAAATGGGLYLKSSMSLIVDLRAWTDSAAIRSVVDRNGISPAAQQGGNVFIDCDGACKISVLRISGSSTVANGGGMFVTGQGDIDLRNMLLAFNAASTNGGGIMVTGNLTLTLANIGFYGNLANNGGGLLVQGDLTRKLKPTVFMDSCVFYNNTATQSGGAMTFTYAFMQINQVLVLENRGVTASGGGIYVESLSTILLSNSLFLNNQATKGGSIMAASATQGSIQDVLATGNVPSYWATWGTLFEATLGFTYLAGKANSESPVTVQFGYLVYLTDQATIVNLTRSNFTHGSAESGGGIYITSKAVMNVDTSTFSYNQASESGGSFLVTLNSELYLTRSTISYSGLYSSHG